MGVAVSLDIHVDLTAFERNVSELCSRVSPAHVWVALKSHAYGHGMLELADNALKAGAHGLAVLDIDAALALRAHGVTATVFAWLHGNEARFTQAIEQSVDLGVSTFDQLDAIAAAALPIGSTASVHLKIDTGLHRNGFAAADWAKACARAREHELSGAITVKGVWSHLADAGDESDALAISKFTSAVDVALESGLKPTVRHIAASSAGLNNSDARFDIVRFGIAAYGISPFDNTDGAALGLTPVMSVASTAENHDDETVRINAGWFDGVPQNPVGAWVLVDGTRCSVLEVHPRFTVISRPEGFYDGMAVALLGNGGPSAEQWAQWSGTIGDEIVTALPSRIRRVFVR